MRQESILRFEVGRTREGNTSVHYSVNVNRDEIETGERERTFSTGITCVCLDGEEKKRPVTG